RDTLPSGDVTVSDVFNAASLGVGTEGELVSVYITGKELKTVLEIDASVQPLMSAAQLYCSGVEYSFNKNRMIFNKVDYAMLRRNDGTLEKIEDDKMYHIVTGMYCGQMLGAVEETSFGLLSVVPKDKDGNPIAISDLADYVVKDSKGTPLKEWYAISSYLQNMGGTMDEKYASTDGRKVVYSSLNPVKLFSNANKFTYILLGLVAVLVLIVVIIVRLVKKTRKRRKSK
ncbi:MAG: 5'-nucleotidase C-terminal domain-containing protein, partial [Oscillospiraceae bacterium]|nr:5'-nucleotidase C-terminal domain-containing protein [Oscillospiraceae bacterium]